MKKTFLGIIMAFFLIVSTCALAACGGKNDPPEGGAWWAKASVSGGTATLTFTSDTEWKLECHGAFLSDDWNPWQSGTYSFDGKPGVSNLRMTATKESPNTFIKDKAVGEEATYEPTDGVYSIIFDVNGKDTMFSFQPPQDGTKPDGSSAPEVCTNHVDNNCDGVCDNEGCDETVAINHVDANNDGKCDKCGNDMPTLDVKVQATLSAENSTIKAKIELKNNNTWTLSMCYYGDAYTPSADGRWSMNTQTYGITLVVENDTANMLAEDSYDLDINYETQKYSATIAITMPSSVPTIGGTALDFAFAQEAEKPSVKEVEKTLNADNGAQKAKIELYNDNTWEVSICFYGDAYNPMASGTWS